MKVHNACILCFFYSKSMFEWKLEVKSLKGNNYLLKPEFTYTPLFRSEPFGNDAMMSEYNCLGYDRFWYTTSKDYYLESIIDFYDHLECNKETWLMSVGYDGTTYPITIELTGTAMGGSLWLYSGVVSKGISGVAILGWRDSARRYNDGWLH